MKIHNKNFFGNGTKRPRFRYGLVTCPGEITDWLRIPATLMLLVGALGLAKYQTSLGGQLLKPLRFPPADWCILFVALSLGFYLFCAIRSIYIKNKPPHVHIYDRPVVPQRWRSF